MASDATGVNAGSDAQDYDVKGGSMLSDTHGRHHNYLRISLTER